MNGLAQVRPLVFMSMLDTAKDLVRATSTVAHSKDVFDLLTMRNAALEKECALLKEERVLLLLKIDDLSQKLAISESENRELHLKFGHAKQLPEDQKAILHFIETADRPLEPKQIAEGMGAETGRTHHLLNRLRDGGYIYEVPTGFRIDDKGRAALHEPL